MLPEDFESECNSGRFGKCANTGLLHEFLKDGSNIEDLEAKVFGGVKQFFLSVNVKSKSKEYKTVGELNIELVERFLKEKKIRIVGKDIGGEFGRKILFFSDIGLVKSKQLK